MMLGVLMCLVVKVSELNIIPKHLCPEDMPGRPRVSYNTRKETVLSLFGPKKKKDSRAATCCRPPVISGRRISASTRRCLYQFTSLCSRPIVCVPPQQTTEKGLLSLGKITRFLKQTAKGASVPLQTSPDSHCRVVQDVCAPEERSTSYHPSNTVERHSYRGGGIMDEILDPYVRPYTGAIANNDFLLMVDNARAHRAVIVEECLEYLGLELMEWLVRSPALNLIEHLLGLPWYTGFTLSPPSKVFRRAVTKLTPCLVFASHFRNK
ncbi:transposable element Tcb2 transposase [Trichonephila clavipes]|nr:transposable element Tcb2 transposase [Trichonephila clavipes]